MASIMEVEFECCGTVTEIPLVLDDDQLALAHASLIDQLYLMAEAAHERDFPGCY